MELTTEEQNRLDQAKSIFQMQVLSLQTLALLEVLKDKSMVKKLPYSYQHLCTRIMFHYNNMCKNKTEIYRKNCKIGSRKWFKDLVNSMSCHEMSSRVHYLDKDIKEWCYNSIDNIIDEEQENENFCIVCGLKYWRYSKWSCDTVCDCDINSHSEYSDSESD